MFPFEVTVTDKIRQWGMDDARQLRQVHPGANISDDECIRCKAILKAALAHYNVNGKVYLSLHVSDIYGKSDEEIMSVIDRKVAANKRSAGARALSNKYGKQQAQEIIRRKTGKTINLQD